MQRSFVPSNVFLLQKDSKSDRSPLSFYLKTPFISSHLLLLPQPRQQQLLRLRRPIQQHAPTSHGLKVPAREIRHDDSQYLLQQLTQQLLRIRQRRPHGAAAVADQGRRGQDVDEVLGVGRVDGVGLDEADEEVRGGLGAGLGIGQFGRDGGEGLGGGEDVVPDGEVAEKS